MREIVTIQVGQCGNQLGFAFWEKACMEHQLAATGSYKGGEEEKGDMLNKIDVFFEQTGASRYVPRTVFVDLEPGVHEKIESKEYGAIFGRGSFVHGYEGAGNCWAAGFFSQGSEIIDEILDAIRKRAESCDALQAMQVFSNFGFDF